MNKANFLTEREEKTLNSFSSGFNKIYCSSY